jgi:hypothetical protein
MPLQQTCIDQGFFYVGMGFGYGHEGQLFVPAAE